jgi:RNA polymerase-binding transcription factor DksA
MDAADFAQKSNEVYLDAALKRQLKKSEASFVKRNLKVTREARDTQQTCCLDCGKEIKPERLAANPAAVRCIECQSKKEREDNNGFI